MSRHLTSRCCLPRFLLHHFAVVTFHLFHLLPPFLGLLPQSFRCSHRSLCFPRRHRAIWLGRIRCSSSGGGSSSRRGGPCRLALPQLAKFPLIVSVESIERRLLRLRRLEVHRQLLPLHGLAQHEVRSAVQVRATTAREELLPRGHGLRERPRSPAPLTPRLHTVCPLTSAICSDRILLLCDSGLDTRFLAVRL
jgi:hypothetical protein